jgi:hypothetical protein
VRRRTTSILISLGTVALFLGTLNGVVNREVIDGRSFVQHADAVRRDPAVATQVGRRIVAGAVAAHNDLVAVRPLLDVVGANIVSSPVAQPIFRSAAWRVHEAFFDRGTKQIVLRLSDVGAVLASVVATLEPPGVPPLPPDLSVTLAKVGGQSFAARTLRLASVTRTLAWVLPLAALACLGLAIGIASDRRRTFRGIGIGVAIAATGVLATASAVSIVAAQENRETLHGALIRAGWHELAGSVWWAGVVLAIAGIVIIASAAAWSPAPLLLGWYQKTWRVLGAPPTASVETVARGVLVLAAGLVTLTHPHVAIEVLAGALAIVLVAAGWWLLAQASALSAPAIRREGHPGQRWRFVAPALVAIAVAMVVGLVTWAARPSDPTVAPAALADGSTSACNGHVPLCNRRYNDVAFVATHNSMTAADQGWYIPNQPDGIIDQLDAGVRALLIDTWYGQTTTTPGDVVTSSADRSLAVHKAAQEFGPDAVTSALRLSKALHGKAVGPVTPYLCHGFCELGAIKMQLAMADLRDWLATHPREVVTLIIEDVVTPADTAEVFKTAGLLPYVHVQTSGQPWPTLGSMIDSGQRLVVFMERGDGGTKYPWLMPAFQWIQDTPYDNPTAESFDCSQLRGSPRNPLLLLNHWLNRFSSRVRDSERVNAYSVLWAHVEQCRAERRIPNFIAVDFYDRGDVFKVVDRLNGFP